MGEEGKSSVPRWIVIATAAVGLVSAILIAATKYYEFHKARAEAARAETRDPPQSDSPSRDKEASPGPGTQPRPAATGFTPGSVWEGFSDPPTKVITRIEIDTCAHGHFKGVKTESLDSVVLCSARIEGTVSAEGDVEFQTRTGDQFTGPKKLIPTHFKGVVRGNQFNGRWTVDSGPSASFTLTRK